MNIEHEVDQSSFQPGACVEVQWKPGAGDPGGTVKVQDTQVFSDFP